MEGAELRMEWAELRMEGAELRMEGAELRMEGAGLRMEGAELRMEGVDLGEEGTEFQKKQEGLELLSAFLKPTSRRWQNWAQIRLLAPCVPCGAVFCPLLPASPSGTCVAWWGPSMLCPSSLKTSSSS
jgi:FtsZ-binding cell division protein ZapB